MYATNVGRDRLALPVRLDGSDGFGAHRIANQAERRVPEQDLTRRRRLLEARSRVDCVPGRECLALARDYLTGVDAGSRLDLHAEVALELVVQAGKRVAHLGGRPHGPERVVLVQRRDPEHGVADEFSTVPRWRSMAPLIDSK
jgi:hypothetical protein